MLHISFESLCIYDWSMFYRRVIHDVMCKFICQKNWVVSIVNNDIVYLFKFNNSSVFYLFINISVAKPFVVYFLSGYQVRTDEISLCKSNSFGFPNNNNHSLLSIIVFRWMQFLVIQIYNMSFNQTKTKL